MNDLRANAAELARIAFRLPTGEAFKERPDPAVAALHEAARYLSEKCFKVSLPASVPRRHRAARKTSEKTGNKSVRT